MDEKEKMTPKTGRPPEYASGAMATLRVRVPQKWLDWLDEQEGSRSEVVRKILEAAMRAAARDAIETGD